MSNYFASFIQGQQAGRQAQQYQQQQEDRNAFRSLVPEIIAGNPGAHAQAAVYNPEGAKQVQGAVDADLQRTAAALKYFRQERDSGDPRRTQAAWTAIYPHMVKVTGNAEGPKEWSEDFLPNLDAAEARVQARLAGVPAGTGNNIQSTYVDADGNRVAIFRDGTSRVLGANNQSIRVLEPEGAVPYGVVTSGGRAGQMVNIGGGQPQPQGAQATPQHDEQAAQRAQSYYQRMRAIGLTDEQAVAATDALLADMGYQQGQPEAASAAPSNNTPAPPAGRLLVPDPVNGGLQPPRTPTAAEKAAASEAAKLGVQLEYAPQMAAAEAEAARVKKLAEAEAERDADAGTRVANAERDIGQIEEALAILPQASGGLLAAGTDRALGAAGVSTRGAQANAQLKLIAAGLIANVPRFEGPQSNIDVQFYREAAGDLANEMLPVETRQAAAVKLLQLRRKASGQRSESAAPSGWGIQRVD